MKKIKKYNKFTDPDVGDYVVMQTTQIDSSLRNFLEKNIGKCTRIDRKSMDVKYYNIPNNVKTWFYNDGTRGFIYDGFIRLATPEEIENLKDEITAKKYNI